MTPCMNCESPIGKLEARHEWDGGIVCDPCYQKLKTARGQRNARVATVVSNKGGAGMMRTGAAIAVVGVAIAIIGFKMFDPEGERLGVKSNGPLVCILGIVACCVGLLCFAGGRIKAGK